LELAVLRAWAVTFLAASFAIQAAPAWLPAPTLLFTVAAVGTSSRSSARASVRFGRGRIVGVAMLGGRGAVDGDRLHRGRPRRCSPCCRAVL